MKTIFLSLLGVITLYSSVLSQTDNKCNANVEALEKQIRMLATALDDESILIELNALKDERILDNRITLSEKDPNPYEVSKEIRLSIPNQANDVEVVFSNSLGQTIKKLGIPERGETSIKVYMSEYLLGDYTYELVVDGQPVKS